MLAPAMVSSWPCWSITAEDVPDHLEKSLHPEFNNTADKIRTAPLWVSACTPADADGASVTLLDASSAIAAKLPIHRKIRK